MSINCFDDEYFRLVSEVLYDGEIREDRTGVGTISKFGMQTKLDLREGFPLLTTKKIDFEAVKAELFWFLSGSTNINDLPEKYRFIWAGWAKEDGDVNRIYGAQWLDWNYLCLEKCMDQYITVSRSVNQIQELLTGIKENPYSRRHIVSAWNVADLAKMALPPCHMMFQCYVTKNKELDMHMYQRSADTAIGVPYNWASYALLQSMIAKECNLTPRYFIHSFGDIHIYSNHIDKIKEQVIRACHKPSTIKINNKSFWETTSKDIQLDNYTHERFIRYEIAI